MLKQLFSRNRISAFIALICCACILISVFAFFTDRVEKSATAAAGDMDLVFTDISSSKTGANGITSNNEFAIDKSWDFASLVSDGGIINPGDYFDLSYNLSNTGSKAMDIRQQLTLTSTVPLTEGAEEYTLSITGENYDTVTLTPDPDESTDTVLVYNLSDITLNGSVEIEDGVSWTDQTYTVRLDFDKNTKNAFMNSGVTVGLKAMAKQHRNTNNDTAWATWAEYATKFEEQAIDKKTVDLFLFAGQSNMAGRGITSAEFPEGAPTIIDGAGYEFRAISDPTKLYVMAEPFGLNENKSGAIDNGPYNTGSLVTAFANAYYTKTEVPVVGVSASKGATSITEYQPGRPIFTDMAERLVSASEFLVSNGYYVRHKYLVWCQGETDAKNGTSKEQYSNYLSTMIDALQNYGIEKCFMIRIGRYNVEGQYDKNDNMINWQSEIAANNDDVVMVSELFAGMLERGLMKDTSHYYQQGYNEVGTDAGTNAANYVNSLN